MATTLLWAAESTGSGYNTISGSATFTLAGGETLVVGIAGFSTSDVGAPTDNNGTFSKRTAAYNAFVDSAKTHGGCYVQFNAASGSHTITPPTISGGSDGLISVWKITGLPATPTVRDEVKKQQLTASNTFNLTTSASCGVGDVAIGMRWHENSAGSTDTITAPSGWTSDWQYLNGSVNLPTDASHFTVAGSGTLSATWTDVDPAITDTAGFLIVFAAPAPTINAQPVSDVEPAGNTASFSVSATASAGSLTYQWQSRAEPAGTWSDIGGATSSTYTTGTLGTSDNGKAYRVNVTDSNGTTTSAVAYSFLTGQNAGRGLGLFRSAWGLHLNRRVGYSTDLIRKQVRSRDTDQSAATIFGDWFGFPATSGTTYNLSATDSITAADAATLQLVAPASVSDALAAADSADALGVLVRSASDAAAATDSADNLGVLTTGATDTATAADAATQQLTTPANAVDAASATDAATSAAAVASVAADSVTTADAATQLAVLPAAAADAVVATDAASTVATMAATATDAAAATDSATGLRVTLGSASDAVTPTDAAAQVSAANLSAADTVNATDAASLQAILVGIVSDGFSAIDAATLLAGVFNITAADVLSLLDAAAADGGVQYTRAPQGGGVGLVYRPGERPPVISGTRPGNINTARPANRGGRRT